MAASNFGWVIGGIARILRHDLQPGRAKLLVSPAPDSNRAGPAKPMISQV